MVPIADRTVRVNLIAQASGYISGMDQAAKKTREVGSEAQKLAQKADGFRALGTAGVAVGVAILGIGAAALKTGIAYNTLQQTSRKALSTILGSASAAADQMDRLDAFAKTSPFAKQVFIKAQQQMLAFGIETKKVIPYMDALQNAVAAAGGGGVELSGLVTIMSKIQSSAKITGQDLLQFGNYGINAAELIGESMGKTGAQIRTEITAGTIDATAALDALASGMATKFAGAAEGMKETFAGSTDRMKAAWRDFSGELAKPLVDPNGGGALIDLFNWAADMMRAFIALPEPVKLTTSALAGLVGVTALAGGTALLAIPKWVAFKVALADMGGASNLAKGALGGMAKFLLNPWTLAVGAAIAIIAKVVDEQKKYQARVDDLTATLDDNTGAITKNTRASVAKSLQDQGAYDAAAKLGLSIQTVTDAAMGQKDALEKVKDAALKYNAENVIGETVARQFGQSVVDKVLPAVGREKDAIAGAKDAHKNLSAAQKTGVAVAEDNSAALSDLSGKAKDAAGDISDLTKAILNFGKGQLDVNAAQRDFQAAIDDATESVKKNGKSLDIGTEAGRNNQSALDKIASSALGAAAAIVTQTGSQDDATAAIQAGRDALIEQLAKMGITGKAAKDYADKLGLIPENIQTVIEANTTPAEKALQKFMHRWDGATINLRATGSARMGSGILGNYQGGLYEQGVKRFAAGGFASGIYNGVNGGIHKFAEKEMGVPWETYISGRSQDRERNIGIWAETGMRLGAMQSAPARYGVAPAVAPAVDGRFGRDSDPAPMRLDDYSIDRVGRVVASVVRTQSRGGGFVNG